MCMDRCNVATFAIMEKIIRERYVLFKKTENFFSFAN